MKKALIFAGLLISALGFSGPLAHFDRYAIDPAHSTLEFSVKHLGLSTVTGSFKEYSGAGFLDEKTGALKEAFVNIQVKSVNTNDSTRDEHILGAEFFDAKKYPEIKFELKKVILNQNKEPTSLQGTLTLKGISKDIAFKITEFNGKGMDPMGNERIGFEASTQINRMDFKIGDSKTMENPFKKVMVKLVGDTVTIKISISAIKQKETPKNPATKK